MTSNHLSEEELEILVQERTAELEKANEKLRAEILERKQAEETLREEKKHLQFALEGARAGMWIRELDGSWTATAQLNAFFGLSPDAPPMREEEFLAFIYPDDLPRLQKSWGDVVKEGSSYEQEYRVVWPDGSVHWLASKGRIYLETGVPQFTGITFDITERKQMEEALRASEARYRSLYENSLDAILLTKPDGTILSANPRACHLFGMTEDEIKQAGRESLVVKNEKLEAALEERKLTGQAKAELTYLRKNGSTFVGEVSSSLFTEADGSIKTSMIIRDITEHKQLEEQLRQRAEELETTMDVVPTPILIGHDPQGNNITGNRMANKFYEAELGENISASVHKARRFSYKGLELPANELPVQQAALKDIDIRDVELDVSLPSGKLRTIVVSASPLHDADGCVRSSVGAFIDITERIEAEAKLKETLSNLDKLVKERTIELESAYGSLKESESRLAEAQKVAHLGNWERNLVTNELHWSDEMNRIFGLEPQKPAPNLNEFFGYIHPDDRDYLDNAIKGALNGKSFEIDYRIISANGKERVIHAQGEAVFDEKSVPLRIRGTAQDITERKKAEEALVKIEEARIKEIHHRIKNNLQVISSLLDLQAEKFSHLETCNIPEIMEAFKESQNRVASMAIIHEELYKGDKIDTLDFASYLKKLTADVFSSYDLGNKNISFKLDLEQVDLGMDTSIPLGIIVNELVSNSFKHAFPAGSKGEIQINLHRTRTTAAGKDICGSNKNCIKKNGFQYKLEISDNGKGIPEEIDFESTDSLGLQLVNLLVEQIDGCMELKRNQGTKFTIWFNNVET